MADKVWLVDADVGKRFGSTRQWFRVQARTNPKFPQPVKLTTRWSCWSLPEIEEFETGLLRYKDDQYCSFEAALARAHPNYVDDECEPCE